MFAGPGGPVAIEALGQGDLLVTRDNGLRAVRWIWSRERSVAQMRDDPRLRPVRIRKGALGDTIPAQDISVSQHHRVLVGSRIAERMFGQSEILVPAKDLIQLEGVDIVMPTRAVTYFHILMPDHEVLVANGLPAESLFLGPVAQSALEPAAIDELVLILGIPQARLFCAEPAPARLLAKGRRVRRLVARHLANEKPLLMRAG